MKRTNGSAKDTINDCFSEILNLHHNQLKFRKELEKFREDLAEFHAATHVMEPLSVTMDSFRAEHEELQKEIKDIGDRFQQEEKARMVADERIEKIDAAILCLQARITEELGRQKTDTGKLEFIKRVGDVDDFVDSSTKTTDAACQRLLIIDEQINELGTQMQARKMSEITLQEEIRDVACRVEQEARANLARIKEFDQQQILQQSWFDDIEAKMETLEEVTQIQSRRMSETDLEEDIKDAIDCFEKGQRADGASIKEFDQKRILPQSGFNTHEGKMETSEALTSPCQPARGDNEPHSNDIECQHVPKQIQDFQRLEYKVNELEDNMKNQCLHQLLEDDALESIQKQTNGLILSQKRLGQLDERLSSAMEAHHNHTNNVEKMKAMVLQEMGDVNHQLAMSVIQTEKCQGGLQECKAKVDAESFQHQNQFKAHARLANNGKTECQSHAKSVSETLSTKVLDCQALKSNTDLGCSAHHISGECHICAHWINLGYWKFSAPKGYIDTEHCHNTAATSRQ